MLSWVGVGRVQGCRLVGADLIPPKDQPDKAATVSLSHHVLRPISNRLMPISFVPLFTARHPPPINRHPKIL